MRNTAITLDALTVLDAIDRRGSFAKAAEELNRATSALSYTIQKLEEQLDVTLFQRQGRRSVLTPAGLLLLTEGRKILGATDYLAGQVKELSSGWEPRLRIGLESTTERAPFYQALNHLLSEQPELEIDIQECVLSGGWEALETNSIDILVGAPAPAPMHKGFRVQPIEPTEMCLAAAPSHPLAKFANQPDVISKELHRFRRIVTHDTAKQNVMRTEGLTTGQQVLYVQTMDQKIQAQLTGLGVGHLPRKIIQEHLSTGALIELKTSVRSINQLDRFIAWRISNKGKARQRLANLLAESF